ncbi:hypothetical protein NLI96_g12808 [Meripilus lineatus]|uniref:Uncharacterized protein n=1 Tax=Meripilus lineatus TaxID=2056292 RepID=A0AAD5UP92_9APHY|nr:hypothetical protein NLI96_g12808 [Physisporinus lineatus]
MFSSSLLSDPSIRRAYSAPHFPILYVVFPCLTLTPLITLSPLPSRIAVTSAFSSSVLWSSGFQLAGYEGADPRHARDVSAPTMHGLLEDGLHPDSMHDASQATVASQ